MSKTGGGRGTNQHQVRGSSKRGGDGASSRSDGLVFNLGRAAKADVTDPVMPTVVVDPKAFADAEAEAGGGPWGAADEKRLVGAFRNVSYGEVIGGKGVSPALEKISAAGNLFSVGDRNAVLGEVMSGALGSSKIRGTNRKAFEEYQRAICNLDGQMGDAEANREIEEFLAGLNYTGSQLMRKESRHISFQSNPTLLAATYSQRASLWEVKKTRGADRTQWAKEVSGAKRPDQQARVRGAIVGAAAFNGWLRPLNLRNTQTVLRASRP